MQNKLAFRASPRPFKYAPAKNFHKYIIMRVVVTTLKAARPQKHGRYHNSQLSNNPGNQPTNQPQTCAPNPARVLSHETKWTPASTPPSSSSDSSRNTPEKPLDQPQSRRNSQCTRPARSTQSRPSLRHCTTTRWTWCRSRRPGTFRLFGFRLPGWGRSRRAMGLLRKMSSRWMERRSILVGLCPTRLGWYRPLQWKCRSPGREKVVDWYVARKLYCLFIVKFV